MDKKEKIVKIVKAVVEFFIVGIVYFTVKHLI